MLNTIGVETTRRWARLRGLESFPRFRLFYLQWRNQTQPPHEELYVVFNATRKT